MIAGEKWSFQLKKIHVFQLWEENEFPNLGMGGNEKDKSARTHCRKIKGSTKLSTYKIYKK